MTGREQLSGKVEFRPPTVEDGAAIWRLVRDSGVLDVNSVYCYLVLCEHFSETCIVAESDGRVVGFVTGYSPPHRDDTLFVWQVGVDASMRGRGVALAMLEALLERKACQGITRIETTISPSNSASRALFAAFARNQRAVITESTGFTEALFPGNGHESEPLFQIGPLAGRSRPAHSGSTAAGLHPKFPKRSQEKKHADI